MTSQEVLARLWTKARAFRGTLWFRIVYLVILGALVAELFLLTATALACLILFLMPLSVFLIPYYFGERRMRHFALNAVPVFLIATLLAGGMATQALLAQADPIARQSSPGPLASPTMALANGTVAPFHSPPDRVFTFRVKLTTTANGTPGDFDLFLNLTTVNGVSVAETAYRLNYSSGSNSSTNTRNGTWYESSVPLGGSIYLFGFAVTDRRANWTFTTSDFGPITASDATFFAFFSYYIGFYSMTFPLLFYFVILFMWWYTKRTRETRARLMAGGVDIPKERVEKEEPKAAEAPGKASKAAAFTCTNCGADVSEDDAKCPKCGAVFED